MKYTPYYRIKEGAETAALFIHGIVGTPMHFQELVPLIPEHWSVYNILLDGHGKNVEDFARTSMAKWEAQVSAQLDEILETHSKVLIVAHSMGTLFAINEAIRRPDQVKGLFLLAVPLTPRVLPSTAVNSVRIALNRVTPDSAAADMENDCGVHLSPKLWKYLGWIPRFYELLVEAHRTKSKLEKITVPCRVFQSARDELVSGRSCGLLQVHPGIRVTPLPHSGHFCYKGDDLPLLQRHLQEMIDTIC